MGILIRTLKPLHQATSLFSTACHSRTAQKMSKLQALIADPAAYEGERAAAQARLKEMRAKCSKLQCGNCQHKSSDHRAHYSDSRFSQSAFKGDWSVFTVATLGAVLFSVKTLWNQAGDKGKAEAAVDGIGSLKDGSVLARYNKSVVLRAVSQNGLALEFAAPYLRKNPDVVLKAVKQNRDAIEFASVDLLSNTDFVITLLETEPHCIYWVIKNRQAKAQEQSLKIEPRFVN